jgi:hypothetical protein
VANSVDIKQQLVDGLKDLRPSLQGVTDAESAKAVLAKLEAAKTRIDEISSLVGQLTPDQRNIIADMVAPAFSDRVLEIPGVGDVSTCRLGRTQNE